MSAFDDYLNAAPVAAKPSFDSYLGASPSPVAAQSQVSQGSMQAPFKSPGSFLMGIGDAVRGGAQDIVHGLAWAADKIAPNSQFAKDANAALPQIQQTIDQQNAQYDAQRAGMQPPTLTSLVTGQKPSTGIDWGRLAGNVVGTAPTFAMGSGGASLLGRVGMGAIQGAAGAGLMPTAGGESFGAQKLVQLASGGALGFAAPLATSAARTMATGLWNTVRPVVQPARYVGEGLAASMEPTEAANAATNIRNAQQFVPGSVPTTAQAAATPVLVATEKAAANSVPGFKLGLTDLENANNQARWSTLSSIARTPADLDAAVASRAAAAAPAYQAARQGMYTVDPDLERLMQRPAMQDALRRGISIASNEGNTGFVNAVQPSAPTTVNLPTGGTGFNGQPLFQSMVTNTGRPGAPAQISGDVLHYMKLGLDDLQQSAQENTRLGPQERRAINQAQADYLGWLDNASPDYAHARAAYAANSPAVNTMQAAQQMVERLGGPGRALNSSGVPIMTAPGYATALARALQNQEFGIEPSAQQALGNIGRDLQRSTISNSIRAGSGSDTAYNLAAQGWLARQVYGPAFNGATGLGKGAAAAATAIAGHPVAAVGVLGAGNRIGQAVGTRLQNQLGNMLLQPDLLLPYLDARAATTAQPVRNALVERLLQYGHPAVVNGLSSGLINRP